jgi:hypothetical protein
LAVLNYDDDLLSYRLFDRGQCIDEYDSCSGEFDSVSVDTEPRSGDSAKLCAAFGSSARLDVERILRRSNDDYTFAIDRHRDLVRALGLTEFAVASSYGSVSSGELPGALSQGDLIGSRERETPTAPTVWSLGLECWLQDRVEGVLLIEAKDFFIAPLSVRPAAGTRRLFPSAQVIPVDFTVQDPSSAQPPRPIQTGESLFAPLEEFILDQPLFIRWYSAASGLAVVREILLKLGHETQRWGAPVDLSPAEEPAFWDQTSRELESLEQILIAAEKAGTRFLLVHGDD